MGKNFSGNNLGQRHASDFYETPISMTEQLFENESFNPQGCVLEPCCGNGAISGVLRKRFNGGVVAYDLNSGNDFFNETGRYHYIITNPPFSKSLAWIEHCKKIAMLKFALLLPLSYLHGQERHDKSIFTDSKYPLKSVNVFTRYPMLGEPLREDGKYHTGMMAYAWYVWENHCSYAPKIDWINNQEYVLSKKDVK